MREDRPLATLQEAHQKNQTLESHTSLTATTLLTCDILSTSTMTIYVPVKLSITAGLGSNTVRWCSSSRIFLFVFFITFLFPLVTPALSSQPMWSALGCFQHTSPPSLMEGMFKTQNMTTRHEVESDVQRNKGKYVIIPVSATWRRQLFLHEDVHPRRITLLFFCLSASCRLS